MTATRPERRSPATTERERSLLREIADLSAALNKIRTGGVDAVMIPSPGGENLYALTSLDRPYRALVEEMGEGAATITSGGLVLYANRRFADLVGRDRDAVVGMDLAQLVNASPAVMTSIVTTSPGSTDFVELRLVRPDDTSVPALASVTALDLDGAIVHCLVVTDLSSRVEAEEKFRVMMDHGVTGMAVLSPQGRFILVNPALCQILGRDAERLESLAWTEVTHPDDVDRDRHLVEQLVTGQVPSFRVRKRYLRPDATVVWSDVSASCVRNDDQSVKFFIAQVLDVTEGVLAERELIQRGAELQVIAAGSADILVRTSPEGRIEYVSPAVTRILGWTPEEILGTDGSQVVHPDDWVGEAEFSDFGGALPRRARIRCRDGSYRWMGTTATPLGDLGNPAGVVAVVRDIEELVEAEEALAESERHFRSLVEGAAEVVFESGPDRRVMWVSPAITTLLGWAPGEIVGTRMADLLEPADRDRVNGEHELVSSGQVTAERHC
ncbi:PAS domain S-box protein [Pengzhenrongella phosphoraccumulans]|uniref:PAS domain S-box protein n=1 Tax=Pengzhenrongella phosphoraccumulans TaxID=3114394 RepID=UPI00388EEBA3